MTLIRASGYIRGMDVNEKVKELRHRIRLRVTDGNGNDPVADQLRGTAAALEGRPALTGPTWTRRTANAYLRSAAFNRGWENGRRWLIASVVQSRCCGRAGGCRAAS